MFPWLQLVRIVPLRWFDRSKLYVRPVEGDSGSFDKCLGLRLVAAPPNAVPVAPATT